MGVVRREELRARLAKGLDDPQSLVITPLLTPADVFDADSVDLRLGQNFLLPRSLQQPYFCPDRKSQDTLYVELFVPLGRYLVVPAHQTVLGATLEFIKLPGDLCGEILTKSSVARTFIVIETAPWVHPEYRGCLTLEIANVSNTPVLLYPGRTIGQLVLLHLDPDLTTTKTEAGQPPISKPSPTYFGPVYPEGPKFNDPEDDLARIGVLESWTIIEKPAPTPDVYTKETRLFRARKIREVEQHLHNRLTDLGPQIGLLTESEYFVTAVVGTLDVSEPEFDPAEPPRGLVTGFIKEPNEVLGQAEGSGGVCVKPGNIRLDLGRLMRLGTPVLKTIHDRSVTSILVLALALWELATSARKELSTAEVVVFRAMWELSRGQRGLYAAEILGRSNEDFKSQSMATISENDLQLILNTLLALRCIRPSTLEEGTWLVAEDIVYEYQ